MLIRKEKNFVFVFIIGSILIIIGLIYGILKKNLGVLLLLVIFGILFILLAIYRNVKRYLNLKKLQNLIKNEISLTGYISSIKKANSSGAKLIKDEIYEIIVSVSIDGVSKNLESDWIDDDYIQTNLLKKEQKVIVYFLNDKNYYFKFTNEIYEKL